MTAKGETFFREKEGSPRVPFRDSRFFAGEKKEERNMLYHGSAAAGIRTLQARGEKRVVYLTDNYVYALFYLRDPQIDFVTCGVTRDGTVCYEERFPDQIRTLYAGRSGWIYRCEESAQMEKTRVPGIWVSREDVPVAGAEYIADAYEAIAPYLADGRVRVRAFETLSAQERAGNDGAIAEYIRNSGIIRETSPRAAFYRERFPAAWEQAKRD